MIPLRRLANVSAALGRWWPGVVVAARSGRRLRP